MICSLSPKWLLAQINIYNATPVFLYYTVCLLFPGHAAQDMRFYAKMGAWLLACTPRSGLAPWGRGATLGARAKRPSAGAADGQLRTDGFIP